MSCDLLNTARELRELARIGGTPPTELSKEELFRYQRFERFVGPVRGGLLLGVAAWLESVATRTGETCA